MVKGGYKGVCVDGQRCGVTEYCYEPVDQSMQRSCMGNELRGWKLFIIAVTS
jgi:hypothetical protein